MKKLSKINETLWGDMMDRSSGIVTRKEDDVNLFSMDDFCNYLNSYYKQTEKGKILGRKIIKVNDDLLSVPVLADCYSSKDIVPQTFYLSLRKNNTEIYISIGPSIKNWAPRVYGLLNDNFTLEDVIKNQGNVISSYYIKIKPKDGGDVTNNFLSM